MFCHATSFIQVMQNEQIVSLLFFLLCLTFCWISPNYIIIASYFTFFTVFIIGHATWFWVKRYLWEKSSSNRRVCDVYPVLKGPPRADSERKRNISRPQSDYVCIDCARYMDRVCLTVHAESSCKGKFLIFRNIWSNRPLYNNCGTAFFVGQNDVLPKF